MYAFKENGQWVEYTGQELPLLDYEPPTEAPDAQLCIVPSMWPDTDKARFGVYPVAETPVPVGKRVASWVLVDELGRPRKIDVLEDIPVEPVMPPHEISRRQFYEGLVVTGRISWAECFAALGSGTLPVYIENALAQVLDEPTRNRARSRLIAAGSFYLTDPFVYIFAALENMNENQVADFWLVCSQQ